MNLTHQHVHHAYNEAHKHKRKWESLKDKLSGAGTGAVALAEVGAGAFVGGVIEGYSQQGKFMHVPINLLVGLGLAGVGIADEIANVAGGHGSHFLNAGSGVIASFTASAGYVFGKTWKSSGIRNALSLRHPAAPALPPAAPQLDPNAIAAAMQPVPA